MATRVYRPLRPLTKHLHHLQNTYKTFTKHLQNIYKTLNKTLTRPFTRPLRLLCNREMFSRAGVGSCVCLQQDGLASWCWLISARRTRVARACRQRIYLDAYTLMLLCVLVYACARPLAYMQRDVLASGRWFTCLPIQRDVLASGRWFMCTPIQRDGLANWCWFISARIYASIFSPKHRARQRRERSINAPIAVAAPCKAKVLEALLEQLSSCISQSVQTQI